MRACKNNIALSLLCVSRSITLSVFHSDHAHATYYAYFNDQKTTQPSYQPNQRYIVQRGKKLPFFVLVVNSEDLTDLHGLTDEVWRPTFTARPTHGLAPLQTVCGGKAHKEHTDRERQVKLVL